MTKRLHATVHLGGLLLRRWAEDVRTKFVDRDSAVRCGFDGSAMLSRNWPSTSEPLMNRLRSDAQASSHSGLVAEDQHSAFDRCHADVIKQSFIDSQASVACRLLQHAENIKLCLKR